MALRLASKIRCNIIPGFTRLFTIKPETAAPTLQQEKTENNQDGFAAGESPRNLHQKFSVYKAPNMVRAVENETMMRQQMDNNKQLQPAMLPDYYKPGIDVQHGTYPVKDTLAHNPAPITLKQRRFEVSKTYANVTLPLKIPKLANPFPDPVKIMSSHTVSDQEKAEQMLAESRVPKGSVQPAVAKLTENRMQRRHYSKKGKTVSRDEEKCKGKLGGKKKKKCVKMVAPGCKPPKTISCDRPRKPIKCKKVKAPYPSYSEACYEEVPEKPSECKLCPWRPKDNPHFKPQKKKYHTEPKDEHNNVAEIAGKQMKKGRDEDGGYLMDARKKPCKDPNAKKKSKKDKKKKKKKKKKSGSGKGKTKRDKKKKKKSKKKKKKKDKKAASWTNAVRRYDEMNREDEETDIVINQKAIHAKGKKRKKDKKKKKKPCTKFPFDKCKKKKDKGKKTGGKDKCKKKKKPIIKGCLNASSWQTIETTTLNNNNNNPLYELAKRGGKKKDKKRKSKSDKKNKKHKGKPKTKDECHKKKPTTRECPADLIESTKRRRRPKRDKKKRTSARAKPYRANNFKIKPYRATKTKTYART